MIKLFGMPMSSSTRCQWMLEEVEAPYEFVFANPREPAGEFAEHCFTGKVPFLVDGDLCLSESFAINAYLAKKYKPELYGATIEEQAVIDQWSYWAITNLQPEALTILLHSRFLPEAMRDPSQIPVGQAGCAKYIGQLAKMLKTDYLVGDRFTLADLNVGSIVGFVERVNGCELPENVAAYSKRLQARPAYLRAMAAVAAAMPPAKS